MPFEGQGGDVASARSPGGFEFGLTGFVFGEPRPTSITFFLDGSAMVSDQYGRCIRRCITPEGAELRFADCAPDANKEGLVEPRPQFATHVQTIEALTAERVDWLAYSVSWRDRSNQNKVRTGMSLKQAHDLRSRLVAEGNSMVTVARTIACAGWPQLPYEELKKLPELPPTPLDELRKIRDPQFRKDALRVRREADEASARESVAEDD
jgi:hypothetical protein